MREGKIPDPLIETIRNRTDLVTVVSRHLTLKKAGQNFMGLCPFHSEKTPSFTVNPTKQFFHCFGCSAGGDVFHFLSKIEQITFPEAVRRLAVTAGVTLPTYQNTTTETDQAYSEFEQIYRANAEAAALFHQNLLHRKEAEEARRYLRGRGVSDETVRTFGIGFALPFYDDLIKHIKAPTALLEKASLIRKGEKGYYDTFRNRMIVPIRTVQGRVVGFGGRALNDTPPKYLNTSETPVFTKGKHLFGLDIARGKTSLIVVEGYFDAMMLHQNGISNAVATMGTAMTPDHLQAIRRHVEKVHLIFDPDTAGIAAAVRTAPLFIESGIAAEVVSLPTGEDPDLFIRRNGPTAFSERLQQGRPLVQFVISKSAQSAGDSIENKTKVIRELFPLISSMTSKVQQGHYFNQIAESFGINEGDVRADFERARVGMNRPEPQRGSPTRITVSSSRRLPEDEATLVALLIQDRLDPARLGLLHPDDFTTLMIKKLVDCFWNEQAGAWQKTEGLVDRLDEAERAVYTRLAVLDIPNENQQQVVEDCIRSLQRKRLERQKLKIQTELKLAERQGNRILTGSLGQSFSNLKKELSQKASSHLPV